MFSQIVHCAYYNDWSMNVVACHRSWVLYTPSPSGLPEASALQSYKWYSLEHSVPVELHSWRVRSWSLLPGIHRSRLWKTLHLRGAGCVVNHGRHSSGCWLCSAGWWLCLCVLATFSISFCDCFVTLYTLIPLLRISVEMIVLHPNKLWCIILV